MRHINNRLTIPLLIILAATLSACRGDEFVVPVEDSVIPGGSADNSLSGMYIVCEGNMGSNKCTIDYLDLSADDGEVHYQRNIFAARNPSTVKELGDVGNDIQVYGARLWIVVNCSNKVEVCTADSCRRIGHVDIPNCRYVTFDGGYAYVSSYVGPVAMDTDARRGRVYKVDTLTLQKVDSVTVGYQPEEMAVVAGKLYVANSGGYRAPYYDNTISVVDLKTMREERQIPVAINLHRLRSDRYGQLWVTSRGDNATLPPSLYWLSPGDDGEMSVGGKVDVQATEMAIVGDTLYYIGTTDAAVKGGKSVDMGLVDILAHKTISTTLFGAKEVGEMTMPYGIAVNPYTKDFYLMDAKNYVSSGQLLHFSPEGRFLWKTWTGDIPSRAAFVRDGAALDTTEVIPPAGNMSRYIAAVDEYVPAPGQFVNVIPLYEDGDDNEAMVRKCTDAIARNKGGMVSLGAWGGYITFHFDHPVENVEGEHDLYIKGNTFNAPGKTGEGSPEPGIVMVSQDTNGNGIPDDEWYELAGSADIDSIGKVMYDYEMTYRYNPLKPVAWTDNRGASGTVNRVGSHQQEYFPLWLTGGRDDATLTFRGTRLPDNATDISGNGTYWRLTSLRFGYADNQPNTIDGERNPLCCFDIGWAVDRERRPVRLSHVDFVRVYSAMNQQCGWLGETSTEICGAEDLHIAE